VTYPTGRFRTPAELRGIANGKLPKRLLVPCGIGSFVMSPTAARACRALVHAARGAGFDVRATGTYRSLAQQEALFRSRYTTTFLPGRPRKVWQGKTWWQLPRTAMAARPGTSNHGLGLAVDFAEERDGDPQVESVSPAFVKWLDGNANRFGFFREFSSGAEPWHWRYVAGDDIPPAVLSFPG
jgi:LAS superfamily LD-carboxypeptidase LdcB